MRLRRSLARVSEFRVGFPKFEYFFGGPHDKDWSILGSMLGSTYSGKLPYNPSFHLIFHVLFHLILHYSGSINSKRP